MRSVKHVYNSLFWVNFAKVMWAFTHCFGSTWQRWYELLVPTLDQLWKSDMNF